MLKVKKTFVNIKFEDINKIRLLDNEQLTIIVRASELYHYLQGNTIEWSIPFFANIRLPKANNITKKLVKDIQREKQYVIDEPIHIAIFKYKIEKDSIKFNFRSFDGCINGGHRLLAISTLLKNNIDLTDIYLNLKLYVALTEDEIKEKAYILNSSTKVNKKKLLVFNNELDFLRHYQDSYSIWFDEKDPFYNSDPFCEVFRIIDLVNLLNVEYLPNVNNKLENKKGKNPLYVVYATNISQCIDYVFDNLHLVSFAIFLQSNICKQIDAKFQDRFHKFVSEPTRKKKATFLPTDELLKVHISSKIIYPLFSGFRSLILNNDFQNIDVNFLSSVVKLAVNKYFYYLNLKSNKNKTITEILRSEELWTDMYDFIEVELLKES